MPIIGLSEARRVPRLGKIHLGKKAPNSSGNGEHPVATDFFVCPPELLAAMGLPADAELRELEIMFPGEDVEKIAPQFYRRYSAKGLTCEGDGQTCTMRLCDADKGGAIAEHTAQNIVIKRGLPCTGKECPEYLSKPQRCKECMNLIFMIPSCPGVGIYQLDTSSVYSMININSQIGKGGPGVPEGFIREAMNHHVSYMPLILSLVDKEVVNPEDPKRNKKKIHVLNLNTKYNIYQLREAANQTARTFMLTNVPAPSVDEPPEDAEDEDGTLSGDTPLKPLLKEPEKLKEIIVEKAPAPPAVKPPATTTTEKPVDPNLATQAQIGKIMACAKSKGISIADVGLYASNKWQVAHQNKLTKKQASDLIELIEGGKFKEELDKLIPQSDKDIDFDEKPPEAPGIPTKAELTEEDHKRMQGVIDKADKVLAEKPAENKAPTGWDIARIRSEGQFIGWGDGGIKAALGIVSKTTFPESTTLEDALKMANPEQAQALVKKIADLRAKQTKKA